MASASSGDIRTGALMLRRALEVPTRQIAANLGVDGGAVVDRMMGGSGGCGFDASRGVYVDLIDAGIIDPTKVVRIALENAVSVAGVLLLTEGHADRGAGAEERAGDARRDGLIGFARAKGTEKRRCGFV